MALVLGAPGVYREPEQPDRRYRGVRLDVAGFVGISPRGLARVAPVAHAVESWSAYQRHYGGFEGPGRLPYAVAAFFAQGGRRAYVVRVVPWDGDETGEQATARHSLDGLWAGAHQPVEFVAANEGAWGTGLRLAFEPEVSRTFLVEDGGDRVTIDAGVQLKRLILPDGVEAPVGTDLLIRSRGRLPPQGVLCRVAVVEPVDAGPGRAPVMAITLAPPPTLAPLPAGEPPTAIECGVVSGTLVVEDGDSVAGLGERFDQLGLHPAHPRWLWSVIADSSDLVRPTEGWRNSPLHVRDPLLPAVTSTLEQPGLDVHERIDVERDFFDPRWDPLVEHQMWRGVHALADIEQIGLLAVPDLFWTPGVEQPPEPAPDWPCQPVFQPCGPSPVAPEPPPPVGELLDGATAESFQLILGRQQRVVALADRLERFVALLDLPQRMPLSRIEQWRAAFDSSFAAGYHPWVQSTGFDDSRDERIDVPPSAVAAGVIAARELALGIPWGPANELAQGVVTLAEEISDDLHDRLHLQGVNVYRQEQQGIRLTGARTLSRDRSLRQLSVRRLMLLIRLTLLRESQWMVFEPNNPLLREEITWHLTLFLRQLYLGGAFTGDTEADAFFVHCDDRLNPPALQAQGQLVAEIGVAPAEPLEYLVLRITQQRNGAVSVEEQGVGA